jgi:alpha-amylase/alpha-mannosidase (GH57 family)
MKRRCENPDTEDYPNYGGRGIKVCDEWHNYVPFREWAIANGYADNLTIDRIDVNGDYTPQNCRWVTRQVQNRNRQHHINLTANGETHILAEWAEITNIGYTTLRRRYVRGWSDDRIVNEPLRGSA